MKPQGYVPPSAPASAHEASDLDVRRIVQAGTVLAVGIVATILVLLVFFGQMERTFPGRTSEASPQVSSSELPPAPRLQMNPAQDLLAVRATEDAHLKQYAWIDREHGVAQIPVERAMELWVKSYAPESTLSTNPAPAPGATELQMRQQKAQEGGHAP